MLAHGEYHYEMHCTHEKQLNLTALLTVVSDL